MYNLLIQPYAFVKNYLNSGHARSIRAKKNIIASFLLKGLSIPISLIVVPLTINYINPTRYGIWLTMTSIVGWFSFFDIGFGNGLRNKFAESLAKDKHEEARIYVSTTYAILSIIISIALILFICINPFLNWSKILNTPPGMAGELSLLAFIVFSFFCLQFVLRLISTIITANQQPAKASVFNFFGNLFSLVVIFILTKTTSGNLINLAIATNVIPVLVLIALSFWYYTHEYRQYTPSIKYVNFKFARNLMTLGLKFFIIQIAFMVLYQTDNIIIAQLFGPSQVTPYNIAYKFFGIIPMVFGIIMVPFWSAFTESWSKRDIEWIKATMKKLQILWALLSVVTLIMLFSAEFIYKLWVGKRIIIPFSISLSIAMYVVINAWNGIYSVFLNGVGKIKIQLYASVIGMILNIPLAIFLGKAMGVGGVILSSVVFGGINMIWSIIQYNKIINNKAFGIWDE